MDALIFISKFVATTVVYFGSFALGMFALKRFEPEPLTLRQTVTAILGTHAGRLRFLFLAGIVSLVLAMLFPGPALLLPTGTTEALREFGHNIWYGSSRPFVPAAPDRSTWFWGQAGLLYLGTFALYIVLGLPTLIAQAAEASRAAIGQAKWSGESQHPNWMGLLAFLAVISAYLLGRSKAKP